MTSTDGLKSLNPSPHRIAARSIRRSVDEKPWMLAVASLTAGVVVCLISVGALGGYALEHPAHYTIWTDRLETIGALIAAATGVVSLLSIATAPAFCRTFNLAALLVIWPLELLLVWILWTAVF